MLAQEPKAYHRKYANEEPRSGLLLLKLERFAPLD
jgi:hypothetical protein